jgi:hypothetical protein
MGEAFLCETESFITQQTSMKRRGFIGEMAGGAAAVIFAARQEPALLGTLLRMEMRQLII